jgi:polysaccharide biosynthesis protein PslH
MNILYLVPHVPNPTKARSYFQIRGLLEAGHQIAVATLERSPKDAKHLADLKRIGCSVISSRLIKQQVLLNILWAIVHRLPLQARFMWSPALVTRLEQQLQSSPPDIIHVEHLRMAQYGLRWRREWPVVWDAVDHLSSLYEQAEKASASRFWRLIAKYEAPRLWSYESWLIGQFPVTLVISREDQRLFQLMNPVYADRVQVTHPGLPLTPIEGPTPRATNTLVITGALNYHPNVASIHYFVKQVFPLVLLQRPDVRLQLVGANPDASIRALRSSQIEVTGFVPSLFEYLRSATVALAPIQYGSGIQNKVLEAFLTETPLVCSSVALRGLDVKPGEHVLVADTAVDFANAVVQLLSDPDLRERIGRAGRHYVEQHHDLKITTQNLVDIYEQVRSEQRAKS